MLRCYIRSEIVLYHNPSLKCHNGRFVIKTSRMTLLSATYIRYQTDMYNNRHVITNKSTIFKDIAILASKFFYRGTNSYFTSCENIPKSYLCLNFFFSENVGIFIWNLSSLLINSQKIGYRLLRKIRLQKTIYSYKNNIIIVWNYDYHSMGFYYTGCNR